LPIFLTKAAEVIQITPTAKLCLQNGQRIHQNGQFMVVDSLSIHAVNKATWNTISMRKSCTLHTNASLRWLIRKLDTSYLSHSPAQTYTIQRAKSSSPTSRAYPQGDDTIVPVADSSDKWCVGCRPCNGYGFFNQEDYQP
jgi:hypothetical protein